MKSGHEGRETNTRITGRFQRPIFVRFYMSFSTWYVTGRKSFFILLCFYHPKYIGRYEVP